MKFLRVLSLLEFNPFSCFLSSVLVIPIQVLQTRRLVCTVFSFMSGSVILSRLWRRTSGDVSELTARNGLLNDNSREKAADIADKSQTLLEVLRCAQDDSA
jgi:hypothetical protein